MRDGDDNEEDVIAYGDEVSGIINGTPELLDPFNKDYPIFPPSNIFSNLFYLTVYLLWIHISVLCSWLSRVFGHITFDLGAIEVS